MESAKYISAILTFVIVFIPNLIFCQEDWKLVKDKDEIKIYTRKTDLSDYKEFKAITYLDCSIECFISTLQDIDSGIDWIYSVVYTRLLEVSADTLLIYYLESKTPWPLSNRDAISANHFIWNRMDRILTVKVNCLPDYMQEESDKVRIQLAEGFWKVEELNADHIKVTFQMLTDPGGSLPAWLANSFVIDSPFETLKKLKRVIKDEKYQDQRYDFIN